MRVLLVVKGFLGDLILVTPVLRALKLYGGVEHLTIAVPPASAGFVEHDEYVDEVMVVDRKALRGVGGVRKLARRFRDGRFDRAYVFHRSPRTALALALARVADRVGYSGSLVSSLLTRSIRKDEGHHEVVRSLQLVAADFNDAGKAAFESLVSGSDEQGIGALRLVTPDEEHLGEDTRVFLSSEQRYVLVAPGSAWETKRWASDGFAAVCRAAEDSGLRAVVVGAKGDIEPCREVSDASGAVNLCVKTSARDLLALIRRAACVVCNDSMTLHVASAFKVPTVAVFCATSPAFGFGPWQNNAVVVERRGLFCKPCSRHGGRKCPTGTRACMTGVSSTEVITAMRELLER